MIFGAHVLLYSHDAEADRAFFRDVLQLKNVDVGGGWLIFALPPAEIAIHPSDGTFGHRHGGHSLLGTQLIVKIRATFGVDLSLRSLFEAATITELAREIERLIVARVEGMSEEEAQALLT